MRSPREEADEILSDGSSRASRTSRTEAEYQLELDWLSSIIESARADGALALARRIPWPTDRRGCEMRAGAEADAAGALGISELTLAGKTVAQDDVEEFGFYERAKEG